MNSNKEFPNDSNGDVLRRMQANGDDLSTPRIIDFCLIFLERKQALAFAGLVDERDLEVRISYYKTRATWQIIVCRHMLPTHQGVTNFESDFTARAESAGGEADGWGCMSV